MFAHRVFIKAWQKPLPIIMFAILIFSISTITTNELAAKSGRPNIPTGSFGCTSSVKKFEKWSKGFEHAAVAIAKAKTITGSRGCGWAWNKKSKSSAERLAIKNCKKRAFHPETCAVAKSN